MTIYSVQPRDRIFVEGYGFLSFAKNMGKDIGKNTSKSSSDKYSQKPLYHVKQFATEAHKTSSKRVIQKTGEATGGLIGNKIANKITKVSKNVETVTNKNDKEIKKTPKGRYMPPEKKQEIIDDLRLK